jgi:hypothetical protein
MTSATQRQRWLRLRTARVLDSTFEGTRFRKLLLGMRRHSSCAGWRCPTLSAASACWQQQQHRTLILQAPSSPPLTAGTRPMLHLLLTPAGYCSRILHPAGHLQLNAQLSLSTDPRVAPAAGSDSSCAVGFAGAPSVLPPPAHGPQRAAHLSTGTAQALAALATGRE